MLIPKRKWLCYCHKPIVGIIHIGAHNCEEQGVYDRIGITKDKVLWIEAIEEKVCKYRQLGYNIHSLLVSDRDNDIVPFNVTNNSQSSSILELDSHKIHYPRVVVVDCIKKETTRMDTFIKQTNVDMMEYNFLAIDIQGAELKALIGFGSYVTYFDYIYLEVYLESLYKECALLHEIDEFMESVGFQRRVTKIKRANWGDVFYTRRVTP